MSRVPTATKDFLGMEMAIHAAQGGSAGVEATVRPGREGTAAKFSGLGSSRSKPSQQYRADQGSPRNQPSESRGTDHRVHMNTTFPSSRANQQTMQRAAHLTDSYSDRRSPKSRNGTAQLTIFYAGTVNVYDVPADKAKAIMALASSGNNIRNPQTMRDSVNFGHRQASPSTPVGSTSASPMTEMPKQLVIAGTVPVSPGASYNQRQNIHSDQLPLSRRLSLQRFLEKRKERATSKSAYGHAPVKPSAQLTLSPAEINS